MAKEYFRSEIARGIREGEEGVNRSLKHEKGKGAILGYAVLAKGRLNVGDIRDWEMDDTSLEQIIQLGNKAKMGIKSRFGHPNMSSEALGTFLGRAKNFRRDGDLVRADLYFDETAYKTPNGDLATYVMDLAENDPAAFGSSIVFDCELEYRLKKDGTKEKDNEDKELPALVRFKKLFANDVVDDPAATPGMFGTFFNSSVELSAKATEFLNKLLSNPDALEKIISFLERYRVNRVDIDKEEKTESKTEKEEVKMDETLKDLTQDQLAQLRPDIVSSLENEAIKNERIRVLTIVRAGNIEFAGKGVEALVEESIEKGFTVDASLASMRKKCLDDITAKANKPPGADIDTTKIKESHLDRAKAYAKEHNCSIREALSKTAETRKIVNQ